MFIKLFLACTLVAATLAANSHIGQRVAGDTLLHTGTVNVGLNPFGQVNQKYHFRDVSNESV